MLRVKLKYRETETIAVPVVVDTGADRCMFDDQLLLAIGINVYQAGVRSKATGIGGPDWSNDPRFQTLSGRKENEDELDRNINEWTKTRLAEDVMALMQKGGVPAAVVENAEDTAKDPQLEHRGHFKTLEHEVIGPHRYDGVLFQLSKSPQGPRWAGPILGKHIEKVCTEFIGMSLDEISDCMVEGVFE